MRTEEKELQTSCENILKALGYEKGTDYLHKQNNLHQKYRKGTNCNMPNMADLVIFIPDGITLFIELKTPTGKLLTGQSEAKIKLISKGHKYYLCRTLIEFIETLQQNGLVI
jgi:hypothetical protein